MDMCWMVGKLGGLPVVRAYAKCVACDHGHLGSTHRMGKRVDSESLAKKRKRSQKVTLKKNEKTVSEEEDPSPWW